MAAYIYTPGSRREHRAGGGGTREFKGQSDLQGVNLSVHASLDLPYRAGLDYLD